MSTDEEATVTIKDGNFTTKVGEQQQELKGTYTVSGTTLTTSEFTLPQEFDGQKMKFTMKLKDGESDVMDLPLSEKLGGNKILVKKSTKEVDLTGTWTGKVNGGAADGTIEFAGGEAHLTVGNDTVDSTSVGQDKNFFTIMWSENNNLKLTKSTGLVSISGKAYLDDGSVFIKISSGSNYSIIW